MAPFFDAARQGRLSKHPIPPFLIQLPVGLWVAAVLLDLLSWGGFHTPSFGPLLVASSYCIEIGLLSAMFAIPFGLIEFSSTRPGSHARFAAIAQIAFLLPAVVLEAANFALREDAAGTLQPTGPLGAALSLSAVCFILIAGYLGGPVVIEKEQHRFENPPLRARERLDRERSTHSKAGTGHKEAA